VETEIIIFRILWCIESSKEQLLLDRNILVHFNPLTPTVANLHQTSSIQTAGEIPPMPVFFNLIVNEFRRQGDKRLECVPKCMYNLHYEIAIQEDYCNARLQKNWPVKCLKILSASITPPTFLFCNAWSLL